LDELKLPTNLFRLFGCLVFNVFFQFSGHAFGQGSGIVVRFGHPTEDAIQLQDDARTATFIAERFFLGALSAQQFNVEAAHLALLRRFVEAAAGEIFATAGYRVVSCRTEKDNRIRTNVLTAHSVHNTPACTELSTKMI
jgi:hypothetical protein